MIDCNTCAFNFVDQGVCAAEHYGVPVKRILSDSNNFPCKEWKMSLEEFSRLRDLGFKPNPYDQFNEC